MKYNTLILEEDIKIDKLNMELQDYTKSLHNYHV